MPPSIVPPPMRSPIPQPTYSGPVNPGVRLITGCADCGAARASRCGSVAPRRRAAASGAARQSDAAVGSDFPGGIPGDLPEVAVGIGEVAGVAAPESVLARLDDTAARRLGLGQHGVDLGLLARVVGERDRTKAAAGAVDARIRGERVATPQRDHHATHLVKRDLGVVVGASPAEPLLVEAPRPRQIGDAERDQAHPLLHDALLRSARLETSLQNATVN